MSNFKETGAVFERFIAFIPLGKVGPQNGRDVAIGD